MCERLTILLITLLIFPLISIGQEVIQQERLDNIDKVFTSRDGDFLLIKSHDNFTLIEEKSRIQLGSVHIPIYNNGHTGQGKTSFVDNSRFIVNTLGEILLVDILNNSIDTLNLNNKFPEIIENFHVLPGEKNQMLIATKIYPMDKNETIKFVEHNKKGEPKYDDTKNCNLYLFDYAQNKILNSIEIPHSLTKFSDDGTDIFAGTFDGKVLRVGIDLLYEEIFIAGEEPIFYLKHVDEKFVVIPHLEKAVLDDLGKGEVRIFDHSGKLLEKMDLPEQSYPEEQDENSFIKMLPSNLIMNVLFLKSENALLINYGFSRVLKLNVSSGVKEELEIDKNFVNFHSIHSIDSQVLITASNKKKGTFTNPSNLAVYDLNLQKDISLFPVADPILEYNKLKKIYWGKDYCYFGKIDHYGELSVIYPSNRSRPLFLKYPDGNLNLDDEGKLLLVSSNQFIYGDLEISKMKKDSLTLRFGWEKEMDDLPSEFFRPQLDSRNFKNIKLPYGISEVQEIGEEIYLVNGYNQELNYYILLLDKEGNILFKREKLERTSLEERNHISPSGKFLAFDYRKGNSDFLEVWDWRENKLIYNKKYPESTWWSYRFDPNYDLVWLKINDENDYSSIHEVDLTVSKLIDRVVLSKISTSDFVADKKRNQIATTDARGFAILELSTGKQLWSVSNSNYSQTMRHSRQGFDLGTKQNYYTVNSDNFEYIYFTSFEGYKPIEISSNLYYSGEKNALKNIAFVSKDRGYLPSDYDLYLNRPDKVLLQSGSINFEYHNLIGKAIEKRTASLPTENFSTFLNQSPELIITNREAISSYTSAQDEILKFRLNSSSGSNLKSYHININGVPLYGEKGKTIEENTTSFDSEIKLKLSKGANTIQLYGIDDKGFISNKEVINIFADYEESTRIYLVLISADTYNNVDYNLKYPVKDARDLAINLQERYGQNLVVDSLFNKKITLDNLSTIREKISKISVNDRVIVFISGHGVLDSNLEFRFATPDMDFDDVDSYGITNSQIENLLLSSPSREKLLLIDACHSGEFDRETYETTIYSAENEDVKMYDGRKGAVASNVRPANSTFELMNQLFTDVSAATGIKVISAAAGNSYALESDEWNNGVFTYALLSSLKENKSIPISNLKNQTYRKVVRLTNGNQQPTSRGETIEFEFSL